MTQKSLSRFYLHKIDKTYSEEYDSKLLFAKGGKRMAFIARDRGGPGAHARYTYVAQSSEDTFYPSGLTCLKDPWMNGDEEAWIKRQVEFLQKFPKLVIYRGYQPDEDKKVSTVQELLEQLGRGEVVFS